MKTKDKIILASLDLFNEKGERNVSTNHIAAHLNMSPGNLYYHFKGKEEIVAALYEQFEADILLLLKDTKEAGDTLEEHWLHLYVVLECIYHYRFFFRNITDLLQKYTVIDSRFRRLVEQQRLVRYGQLDAAFPGVNLDSILEGTEGGLDRFDGWVEHGRKAPHVNISTGPHVQSPVLVARSDLPGRAGAKG